ncbi:MAG: hypothetical protein IT374_23695 [Polyangiaceae bacterium]|nr:hypothetical protein [Polyangiaceae bacterium]
MHSLSPSAQPSSPCRGALALAPLVERFCEGRRVAVLGVATSGLALELSRRGARLVHAYDPEPARVAEALITQAGRGVSYATLTDGDLGVRDGAFDVTVVCALTDLGDASAAISRARRLTSASGVVVVAGGEGEGALGYYELYDTLSLQLPDVRMLGVVDFSGVSLVDLASGGEGEVSIDTSLAPAGREPSAFVAVASARPLSLDALTLVELPATSAAPAPAEDGVEVIELRAQLAASAGEVERLREDRAELVARVAEADRRTGAAVSALADAEAVARASEARLVEAARARELVAAELAKQKQEAARQRPADPRPLADAQAALSRAEARERALAARVVDLEGKLASSAPSGEDRAALAAAKSAVTSLEAALADVRGAAAKQERELSAARDEASRHARALADATRAAAAQGSRADSADRDAMKAERDAMKAERDAALADVTKLEAAIVRLEARLAALHAADARAADGGASDLAAAEATLRDRAREIAALEREVENRGDMVRALVSQLSRLTGADTPSARGG